MSFAKVSIYVTERKIARVKRRGERRIVRATESIEIDYGSEGKVIVWLVERDHVEHMSLSRLLRVKKGGMWWYVRKRRESGESWCMIEPCRVRRGIAHALLRQRGSGAARYRSEERERTRENQRAADLGDGKRHARESGNSREGDTVRTRAV